MSYYSDAVFYIEVRRYVRAAECMLIEVLGERFYKLKLRQKELLKKRVAKELEAQRKWLREWRYLGRIDGAKITEMAEETYERTYQSLRLDKYDENIIEL